MLFCVTSTQGKCYIYMYTGKLQSCMLYANLILCIGEVTAMVPCVEGLRIGPDPGVTLCRGTLVPGRGRAAR